MNWNSHYNIKAKGMHSFLSASKFHWINYDADKLMMSWENAEAAALGTRIYVNDAIGYKMKAEQVLYYSDNAFGTADAISFRKDPKTGRYFLRIHDLKTGTVPAHMEQLMIYAGYFCLEYGYKPRDIDIELRIYQNDQVLIHNAFDEFKEGITGYDMIEAIIKKIIAFDKLINEMKAEV